MAWGLTSDRHSNLRLDAGANRTAREVGLDYSIIAALMGAAIVVVFCFAPFLLGNLWSLATGRGFFIPAESSIFTFQVTEENLGSGEWWLYGKDKRYLYALHEKEPVYLVFPRAAIGQCQGFAEKDYRTWCSHLTRRIKYE